MILVYSIVFALLTSAFPAMSAEHLDAMVVADQELCRRVMKIMGNRDIFGNPSFIFGSRNPDEGMQTQAVRYRDLLTEVNGLTGKTNHSRTFHGRPNQPFTQEWLLSSENNAAASAAHYWLNRFIDEGLNQHSANPYLYVLEGSDSIRDLVEAVEIDLESNKHPLHFGTIEDQQRWIRSEASAKFRQKYGREPDFQDASRPALIMMSRVTLLLPVLPLALWAAQPMLSPAPQIISAFLGFVLLKNGIVKTAFTKIRGTAPVFEAEVREDRVSKELAVEGAAFVKNFKVFLRDAESLLVMRSTIRLSSVRFFNNVFLGFHGLDGQPIFIQAMFESRE